MPVPQPLEIKIVADPAPNGPSPVDWADPVRQLRDVAKWIVGSVAVTVAGVLAGSSLTALGALDPVDDRGRLLLAAGGALVGLLALAFIFVHALAVLAPSGSSLVRLANEDSRSSLGKARSALYELNDIDEQTYPLIDLLDPENEDRPAAIEYLPKLYRTQGFAIVRYRFDMLLRRMSWCLPFVIGGLGIFAWAANPAPKSTPMDEIEITTPLANGGSEVVRTQRLRPASPAQRN